MEDFAALFPEDKIEKLVDFLFDTLNPQITEKAQKIKSESSKSIEEGVGNKRKRQFDIDTDLDSLIKQDLKVRGVKNSGKKQNKRLKKETPF